MFLPNIGIMMSQKKKIDVAVNTENFPLESTKEKAKRLFSEKSPIKLQERSVRHIKLSVSSDLKNIYNFGDKIGQGAFATVISVVEKSTESEWAMKIVSKAVVGNKISAIQKEIQILKMVNHPHIIYLDRIYETMENIYMVLEKCVGTLSNAFQEVKPFSEEDVQLVVGDLISAVAYLHKHDIVHRDLKLENILIAKNPNNPLDTLYIKVTDFGLSTVKKGSGYEDMLKDYCGTLHYMAPEIITKHTYSQQCDIWAAGVIMYTLLKGDFPFNANLENELTAQISNKEPKFSDLNCSRAGLHLLSRMLVKNPALRITASEITEHPWITGETYKPQANLGDNVLDMMRLWRTEMTLPTTNESDWIAQVISGMQNSSFVIPKRVETEELSVTSKLSTKQERSKTKLRSTTAVPVRRRPSQINVARKCKGKRASSSQRVSREAESSRQKSSERNVTDSSKK